MSRENMINQFGRVLTSISYSAENIANRIEVRANEYGGMTQTELKEIFESLLSIEKRLKKIREKL